MKLRYSLLAQYGRPALWSLSRRLGWLAALLLALLAAPAARAQTLDWQSATSLNPALASGTSLVRGVAVDSAGVQYLTGEFSGTLTLGGTTLTSAGSTDVFVAARSAAGTWLWASRGGGSQEDRCFAVAVTGQGATAQVFVTGGCNTTVPISFGSTTLPQAASDQQHVFIAALTGTGAWRWARKGGGGTVGAVAGRAIAAVGNGSGTRVYVTGTTQTTIWDGLTLTGTALTMAYSVFVVALDGSGAWQWGRFAGGSGGTACTTVSPLPSPTLPGTPSSTNCRYFTASNQGLGLAVSGSGAAARVYVSGHVSAARSSSSRLVGNPCPGTVQTGPLNSGTVSFGSFSFAGVTGRSFVAALDAAGTWQWAQLVGQSTLQGASYTTRSGCGTTTTIGPLSPTGTAFIGGSGGVAVLGTGSAARVYATGYTSTAASFGTLTATGTAGVGILGYVAAFKANGACRWARVTITTNYGLALGAGTAGPRLLLSGSYAYYLNNAAAVFGATALLPYTTSPSMADAFVAALDTSGTWQTAQRAGGAGTETANALAADPTQPGQTVVGGTFQGAFEAGTTTLPTGSAPTGWLGTLALNPAGATIRLTAISPGSGPVNTLVTLTGSNLNLAAQVSFNGTVVPAGSFVSQSATSIQVRVPTGATSGLVIAAAANGVGSSLPFTVTTGTAPGPLVISTGNLAAPVPVAAGSYTSLTVTGTGVAQLAGPAEVSDAVTVQAGGVLLTACQPLTGAGSFTLAAGATLGICDPDGLSSAPGTGAVQLSGARSFSADATYLYTGTQPQATGDALPAQVRSLTTTNASDLTLSGPLSVRQTLTVGDAGNLATNGQALTLLSDATGSALVVNGGSGVVLGDATVQRYIDPSLNAGSGYRHYSAPTTDATVASLTTSSFTPTVNPAYNSSATPAQVRPFPTVFGYDAARLTGTSNNLSAFDKGWFSPQALTDALAPGRGYTVQVAAAERVAFTGQLGNDSLRVELPGNAAGAPAEAGWVLLGNPYPAPLDYALMAARDRAGLDPALYVVQSTGPYRGGYRAYNNGISTTGPDGLLATAQGFFVHVGAGQAAAHLTFRNSQRVTDYATAQQVNFQRSTADLRPLVRLTLAGAGLSDSWVTYAEAGASPTFEPAFDALKLANSTGLNLGSTAGLNLSSTAGTEQLAIDGQAAFTAATGLPLTVGVPAAGTYTLAATTLANLPAGLNAWLLDLQTGQSTLLTGSSSYAFTVTTNQATALLTGRFSLRFGPTAPLATAAAALAEGVQVYPNPARGRFTVAVPGVAGATQVQLELLNALGQVVRRQPAALPATGTTLAVEVPELASGLYALRLTAGPATITKRVVLD